MMTYMKLKLAKLIIDNIPNNINNKQKFDKVMKDIMNIDDLYFIKLKLIISSISSLFM